MSGGSCAQISDSPVGRRVIHHRRTTSHLALHGILDYSLVREQDRRDERNQLCRNRHRRVSAALLREMREFFGLPVAPHQWPPRQQQPDTDEPIVISSDSSGDKRPNPEQVPEPVVIEIADSTDTNIELPNINLLLQQLPLPVPEAAFREAFALLHRLQEPPPLTIDPTARAWAWGGLGKIEDQLALIDKVQQLQPLLPALALQSSHPLTGH